MGIFTRVCYNEHNEITVVWLKSWNGKESCAVCFIGSKHINMRWGTVSVCIFGGVWAFGAGGEGTEGDHSLSG